MEAAFNPRNKNPDALSATREVETTSNGRQETPTVPQIIDVRAPKS